MHVRFHNPQAQEWGRQAHAALVDAGLVPPPVMKHRARRGDTLSVLARRYGVSMKAIRAANGLRGSALRAGRVYRIPTCVVADSGPIVVPPRRLPPASEDSMARTEQTRPAAPMAGIGSSVSSLTMPQ